MKKILFSFIFVTMMLTAHAQSVGQGSLSFIPRIGVDFAKLSNHEVYGGDGLETRSYKAQFSPGFTAGASVEYMALDNLGVELGFQYARQGTDSELDEAEISLHYINVPLMANFYVIDNFAFRIGGQLGFLTGNDLGKNYTAEEADDALKKVDFSIPIGLSFEYENFILGVRYNIGLTRVFKNDYFKEKNQVFMVDLGYRIAL